MAKIEQNIHNDEILNHRKRQADTDFGEPLGETFIDSQYSQESIFLKDLQSDCINWLWNLSTISLPYTGHVASKSFEQKVISKIIQRFHGIKHTTRKG